MKNAFVIFAFFLLISSSFATKATLSNKLLKFGSTEFGRAIIETIQVELETQADPRPRIIELLEQLRQETIDAQTQADEDIAKHREFCSTTIAGIKGAIEGLNNTITTDTADKVQKEADKLLKEEDQRVHNEAKAAYESQLQTARDDRARNQKLYEETDAKYAKILEALQTVRDWIANRKGTRYDFLQKKDNVMPSLVQIQSEEFMKISPGMGKLVAFLAAKVEKSLEAPTEADATAESGLQRILDVIDPLITNFRELKLGNFNFNENDINLFKALETRLLADIAGEEATLAALAIEISGLEQSISHLEDNIAANEKLLETKQSELTTTEINCDSYERTYESTTSDRNKELSIIEEVLKIVREELTGRAEYTENVIVNSDINVD